MEKNLGQLKKQLEEKGINEINVVFPMITYDKDCDGCGEKDSVCKVKGFRISNQTVKTVRISKKYTQTVKTVVESFNLCMYCLLDLNDRRLHNPKGN